MEAMEWKIHRKRAYQIKVTKGVYEGYFLQGVICRAVLEQSLLSASKPKRKKRGYSNGFEFKHMRSNEESLCVIKEAG